MRPKKFVRCENTLILILNKLEKNKNPGKKFFNYFSLQTKGCSTVVFFFYSCSYIAHISLSIKSHSSSVSVLHITAYHCRSSKAQFKVTFRLKEVDSFGVEFCFCLIQSVVYSTPFSSCIIVGLVLDRLTKKTRPEVKTFV